MTKWDKILIIFVLTLSILGLIFVLNMGLNIDNEYVVISENGEIIKRISVSGTEKNQIYDFNFGDNYRGYIEINKGEVRMLEMNREVCPEGICSDTGWISNYYQSIVCLPNKLIISFEQKSNEEIDILLQ